MSSETFKIGKIYQENCISTLGRMPDDLLDMTLTSPPYDDLRDYNGYHFPVEEIAELLFRKTKNGGVVVWVVGSIAMLHEIADTPSADTRANDL